MSKDLENSSEVITTLQNLQKIRQQHLNNLAKLAAQIAEFQNGNTVIQTIENQEKT